MRWAVCILLSFLRKSWDDYNIHAEMIFFAKDFRLCTSIWNSGMFLTWRLKWPRHVAEKPCMLQSPDNTLLQIGFELQIDMLKHSVISKKRFLIGLATLYPFLFLVKSDCSIDLITNTFKLAIENSIYVCLKGNQWYIFSKVALKNLMLSTFLSIYYYICTPLIKIVC